MTKTEEITTEPGLVNMSDQLQAALEAAVDASVALLADMDELVSAAREAVDAWQGQGNLNLAMARLARCVARHQAKG